MEMGRLMLGVSGVNQVCLHDPASEKNDSKKHPLKWNLTNRRDLQMTPEASKGRGENWEADRFGEKQTADLFLKCRGRSKRR